MQTHDEPEQLLAQDFIDKFPNAAALMLSQHKASELQAFFNGLDDKTALKAIYHIYPKDLATILSRFDESLSHKLLKNMDEDYLVATLRYMPDKFIKRYSANLTSADNKKLISKLNFDITVVGAWLSTNFIALPINSTVSQALNHIKCSTTDSHHIFAINSKFEVLGQLSFCTLLRAQSNTPISSIINNLNKVLRSNCPVEQALAQEEWQQTETLPVVNKQNQLLGYINHATLTRAYAKIKPDSQNKYSPQPIYHSLIAYGQLLSAFAGSFSQLNMNPSNSEDNTL